MRNLEIYAILSNCFFSLQIFIGNDSRCRKANEVISRCHSADARLGAVDGDSSWNANGVTQVVAPLDAVSINENNNEGSSFKASLEYIYRRGLIHEIL